jgi:3-methyladenine DNA glycosylase/8-oxoguanine DNA glycosylase
MKHDVVPIDVHMFRMAQKLYGFVPSASARGKRKTNNEKITMNPLLYEEVANHLKRNWSPWAGWAQAILFASNYLSILGEQPTGEMPVQDE